MRGNIKYKEFKLQRQEMTGASFAVFAGRIKGEVNCCTDGSRLYGYMG